MKHDKDMTVTSGLRTSLAVESFLPFLAATKRAYVVPAVSTTSLHFMAMMMEDKGLALSVLLKEQFYKILKLWLKGDIEQLSHQHRHKFQELMFQFSVV